MRRYLPVAVVVLLVGGFALAELLGGAGGDSTRGRPAPPLPRRVLVEPRVTLASLRGRPAVVHFWASWCDPCRREAPELARLPVALGRRAQLVGIDWTDGLGSARLFVERYRWRFPNLIDASGAVGDRYGLTGMPTTYVLDRRGRIRATLRGPQSVASVERALKTVD